MDTLRAWILNRWEGYSDPHVLRFFMASGYRPLLPMRVDYRKRGRVAVICIRGIAMGGEEMLTLLDVISDQLDRNVTRLILDVTRANVVAGDYMGKALWQSLVLIREHGADIRVVRCWPDSKTRLDPLLRYFTPYATLQDAMISFRGGQEEHSKRTAGRLMRR